MAYTPGSRSNLIVTSEDVAEPRRRRVPLRRKRSAYRRARTEFSTPAFEQFQTAGPSVAADKGKAPMPDLDIPAEFLAEDAQARKRFEKEQASERLIQRLQAEDLAQEDLPHVSEERAKELDDLMMRMTETDWLNLMLQVGSNPALARELLGADVNEENFIERMTAVKERKKRALADLRYRALKGKPMKKSEVTQMMRNLVKNQCYPVGWLVLRILLVQLLHVAGSAASNPAGGAFGAPVTDSTVTTTAAMDSAGTRRKLGDSAGTAAAMVSPFADSAAGSSTSLSSIAGGPSPSNVSTDRIPIDVLFEYTSGGINEFFLESDEEEQFGMSRVVADPDSDDEVLAEIIFRGKSISADGVVFVDKLPDDEIVDPRVKVEIVSESASSPPRSRRKHLGVRSDDFLWDKPVEDFFSSESESDDDMENYIPPLPYGAFKDWEIVSCPLSNSYYHVYYQENRRRRYFTYLKQLLPHVYREDLLLLRRRMNRYFRLNPDVDVGLDLWRDVNMLCQSLHSDDVEDFWRTQDEWIVCSWQLYPKSSVHVLDLTNGKTVYMFVDKFYPIRATLLERMLRHRLTVPPSYCRDVVVAGNIIQTVQDGLRQAYECIASAPIACTARQMVFSSPWLTAKKRVWLTIANGFGVKLKSVIAVGFAKNHLAFIIHVLVTKRVVVQGVRLLTEQTATGAEPPKTKASVKKKQIGSDKTTTSSTTKGKRLKTSAKIAKPAKKKQPAKTSIDKGLTVLSKVALTEAEQLKLVIERSKTQTHNFHASGSGADEGTGAIVGVPDVPTYNSDDEKMSWKSSDEEDDDEVSLNDDDDDDDIDNLDDDDQENDDQDDDASDDAQDKYDQDDENQDDDNEQTNSDNDGDDFIHPKFSTHDDQAKQDEEVNEEYNFDPRVQTPSHVKSTDDEDNDDEI
ncbi:hypothetical protein Tco_1263429 [Tanacetum coccineum]